jgi:hypothetical protein
LFRALRYRRSISFFACLDLGVDTSRPTHLTVQKWAGRRPAQKSLSRTNPGVPPTIIFPSWLKLVLLQCQRIVRNTAAVQFNFDLTIALMRKKQAQKLP